MRCLFLTQFFPPEPGAGQYRLSAMVRELVALGHQVEVVTAMPNYPLGRIYPEFRGALYRREIWNGAVVHRTWLYARLGAGAARALSYVTFAVTSLGALLKARRPNLVCIESPPPLLALHGVLAARYWDVPLVLNVADLWPDTAVDFGILKPGLKLDLLFRLEAWAYKHATSITAMTEGIRNRLAAEKGVPKDKIVFLPNGIDPTVHKPMPPDRELAQRLGLQGRTILLYAGTAGYAHAAEKFLYAAQSLTDTSAQFVFLGGGSGTAVLQRLARELKLTNVTFLRPVAPEEVTRYFSIAYAGLASVRRCPVMQGARAAKMLAIMACGKPVVYAGDGEGADLLEQAGAGIAVRAEDPQLVGRAIRSLMDDPAGAAQFGIAGRKFIEHSLSWPSLIENWLRDLAPALPLETGPDKQADAQPT